jgi:hypothetical protein
VGKLQTVIVDGALQLRADHHRSVTEIVEIVTLNNNNGIPSCPCTAYCQALCTEVQRTHVYA